jgi:hypothetical protein
VDDRDTDPNQVLDLTAEAEVADEAAENLAFGGPPDNSQEVTPTIKKVQEATHCRECRGPITVFEDFIPQPKTPDDAWKHLDKCYTTKSDLWSWCPKAGIFVGRLRVSWERRSRQWTPEDQAILPTEFRRKPSV